jgi:hypothetical protein
MSVTDGRGMERVSACHTMDIDLDLSAGCHFSLTDEFGGFVSLFWGLLAIRDIALRAALRKRLRYFNHLVVGRWPS